jgi:3-oxoacyl-[acyl-carrier-protein] synthase III
MNQDEAWGTAGTIEDVSGQVAIVGVGDAIYQRASGKNGPELAIEATERALADSGLAPSDIDGIMVTPYMGAQLDADAYRAHFGTEQEIWMSNEGGAMTWAATAPAVAAAAIREGKASARREAIATKDLASFTARNA